MFARIRISIGNYFRKKEKDRKREREREREKERDIKETQFLFGQLFFV